MNNGVCLATGIIRMNPVSQISADTQMGAENIIWQ